MKGKGLVPLLIIAVILVGLVIWKKTSAPTRTLSEQVDLVALLPDDVEASTLGKLELYAGAKPDEKVVLARTDSAWQVESHFNAPVAEEKIDEYIKSLDELKGEFREEVASDDDLKAFDLTDDSAFHVVGYAKDATEPAFHVLVGKAPDYRTVFMRPSDQKKVYVEDTNLRQLAGVYGDTSAPGATPAASTPAAAPTATPWLDKKILELDQAKMAKIELKTPDKTLVFEKQAPAAPAETPAEGDAAAPDAQPAPEPPAEPKWVLVSGGPGGELKPAGIDNVVRKIATLSATDIVDPAKKAEWGLEPAQFSATVTLSEGEPVVIEGGRAEGATDGYVRVASASSDRVYKLDSYGFGQLFPKGSALFTLEGVAAGVDAIDRIAVTQPEGDFAVTKSGEAWTVESPAAKLPAQTTAIDTMKSMLSAWKPDDYADAVEGTGLDAPTRSVTFSVAGESRTIHVGNASKSSDGYYAKLDGNDKILTMSKTDYQKVFVEPKNLFQLKLVDAPTTDMQSIAVERADDAFTLAQTDGAWSLASGGPAGATVDQDKASALANALAALQAADIIAGERAPGAPIATVRVNAADGVQTLAVEAEQEGRYPVTLAEIAQAVWVDKADMDGILVASATLAAAPEPAAPPAALEAPADAPAAAAVPAPETPAPATVTIDPSALGAPADAPAPAESPASAEPAAVAPEAPATEVPAPAAPEAVAPVDAAPAAPEAPATEAAPAPAAPEAAAPADAPAAPEPAPAPAG